MKHVKAVVILSIVVIVIIGFALSVKKEKQGTKKKTVALLVIGMESPYVVPYTSNLTDLMQAEGIKTIVFNGKFDPQLQTSQMDNAIAMRPDAIVLFAADSQAMVPGIKKAFDRKIPVIMSNNRPISGYEKYTTVYAGPDYYTQGQLAAEMANERLKGKGKIVIIEGLAGQEAQINRNKGFQDKLNANIEILANQTADWRKDLAMTVMQDFIIRYRGQINAVYTQDDTMAIGAAIALEEAGIQKGSIPIISIGGSREGLKAVKDGVIYGTITQSPVTETSFLVPIVLKILKNGIKPPAQYDPYWNFMGMPKVTKTNVEKYLPGDW